jgi:hypothetical protein
MTAAHENDEATAMYCASAPAAAHAHAHARAHVTTTTPKTQKKCKTPTAHAPSVEVALRVLGAQCRARAGVARLLQLVRAGGRVLDEVDAVHDHAAAGAPFGSRRLTRGPAAAR